MRVSILLQITADDGTAGSAAEVAAFEKATERAEDVGLSLTDGKALLAAVQRRVVQAQAEEWAGRHRCCASCGAQRRSNGSYPVLFRTLYGDVQFASPRLHRCACRDGQGPATLSPLRDLIPGHVAPERLYLEARWASLVPYAAAADLLTDVLPLTSGANATTLRQHVLRVAEQAEGELGKEQSSFIDGCPAEWAELPIPEGRIVVGLDGGYVRDWDDKKANFELIVGRSMPDDRDPRYVGLVHGYDQKPKRRLFELLKAQGLQANQDVTFQCSLRAWGDDPDLQPRLWRVGSSFWGQRGRRGLAGQVAAPRDRGADRRVKLPAATARRPRARSDARAAYDNRGATQAPRPTTKGGGARSHHRLITAGLPEEYYFGTSREDSAGVDSSATEGRLRRQ